MWVLIIPLNLLFFCNFKQILNLSTNINLLCKSMEWFLYDGDLHHEWVTQVFANSDGKHVIKYTSYRSIRPEVFCRKGVLRNFSKFTGNTCTRSSFLIKLQAWGLRTPFFTFGGCFCSNCPESLNFLKKFLEVCDWQNLTLINIFYKLNLYKFISTTFISP